MAKDMDNIIIGAALLTVEQAESLPQDILKCGERWWLKTPGYTKSTATCVFKEGVIDGLGSNVERHTTGIRPVLLVRADGDCFGSLRYGKQVEFVKENGEHVMFYYIGTNSEGQGMLLTKNCIATGPFKVDWKSQTANQYDRSDVKGRVDGFYEVMRHSTLVLEKSAPAAVPAERVVLVTDNDTAFLDDESPRKEKIVQHFQRTPRRYKRAPGKANKTAS